MYSTLPSNTPTLQHSSSNLLTWVRRWSGTSIQTRKDTIEILQDSSSIDSTDDEGGVIKGTNVSIKLHQISDIGAGRADGEGHIPRVHNWQVLAFFFIRAQ
jgi:hypothetical protein